MAKGRPVGYEVKSAACPRHDKEIRKWAAEGRALTEIGRLVGTTHHRVREYLTRHSIPYDRKHNAGPNNPAWRGGRTLDKYGYVLVWQPDHPAATSGGYVREHRLVMEQQLGRYLTSEEVVHHKDDSYEGRSNNDPGNLVLYSSNAEHLADTLLGRTPQWSPEGWERMKEHDTQAVKDWWATNGHLRRRAPDGTFQKTDDCR